MIRVLLLALIALLVLAACGGSGDDDGGDEGSATTTAPADDADPEALAQEMIDEYAEMNGRLADLLAEDLPPEELAPEIAALKDEYIEVFVEIGYRREPLSDDEVTTFNNSALVALNNVSFDHQDAVNELLSELNAAGENELASEINSLNILTQYAQFELLWDQEPEEAQRLDLPSPAHPR